MVAQTRGRILVPLLVFTLGVLGACALPEARPSDRLVIATWNVQNLFDEVDDGGEYPEFDPQKGWTRAQFWARCQALARVIRSLEGGPDILVLEEVEGEYALEVLNTRFLPDLGYRHSVIAPSSVPGVKTAFLSRYRPQRTGLHFPGTDQGLRPLVEAEFDLGGRALVIVANHWKSRIPTPGGTEPLRLESARVLSGRLADLDRRADHPVVVAVGDLNTSLELSRPWKEPALVSATSERVAFGGVAVYTSLEAAQASQIPGAVWEPWDTVVSPPGSYVYRGEWNRLDHILVTVGSLNATDWRLWSFGVGAWADEPQAWGPLTPDGVSDHFPLVLVLARGSGRP